MPSQPPIHPHGVVRGLDKIQSSEQFEGRFGRMFRTLPPAHFTDDDLGALAQAMVAKADTPTPEDQIDDEENTGTSSDPGISAGYTYLGQFIDHDLTFDPASSLQKQNDPDGLVDFRTPRFDLDNLYGRGPNDQPYLYAADGVRMLLGRTLTGNPHDPRTRDVERNAPDTGPKRALIGDPRNDENVIVSQLQSTFLRFHNRVADVLNAANTADFPTVQRLVRWHYQWVVVNDFLPTILGAKQLGAILPHVARQTSILKDPPDLRFFRWKREPFMPVEFSVAAYRFGHSMVRPIYRLNTRLPGRQDIFSIDPTSSLTGFREFPANWAIDWQLFFRFAGKPPSTGPNRVQPAYKIDTSLVNPLGNLPPSIAVDPSSLARRNLLRGRSMGLPSGQAVARKIGVPVVPDGNLRVGKATEADAKSNPLLVELSPRFRDNAPLWYYILAESQQAFARNDTPIRLGPVGARIVGEVFAGLLVGDQHSYFNQDPTWKPLEQFTQGGKFGIVELISQAQQA
ncbi:MAG: heme peroxidase family protein [Acidobacteriota bacterium]|nr:heme peroxidase family protein [Acidobacteriota bacterium]